MKNRKRPVAVDLFAGAGGMTLGFEQAGFDVKVCVESDPIHANVHKYNFPHCKVINQDILLVSGSNIAQSLQGEEVDVVFGGPPCQGFSVGGKQLVSDLRSQLVFEFARIVSQIQPRVFVMENVPGMSSCKFEPLLIELNNKFRQAGYKTVMRVLNAADFGVAQRRKRVFIVGFLSDVLPDFEPRKYVFPISVSQALDDLPDVDLFPELLSSDTVKLRHELNPSSIWGRQAASLMSDSSDYSYPRDWDRRFLTSSARTVHSPEVIERFKKVLQGKKDTISRFPRLDPKGVCPTLRAGTSSSQTNHTALRPIHPYYHRCITVREGARLHSYPDWFRFHVSKWHGFRELGNSVPPRLAKAVATEVMEWLGYAPVKPIDVITLGDVSLLGNLYKARGKYE